VLAFVLTRGIVAFMAPMFEFAFIPDEVAVLYHNGGLVDGFEVPPPSRWFPMYETNERRLAEQMWSPLFICPEGIGGTACKYCNIAGPLLSGCAVYRHIKGKHRALLVRTIPHNGAVITLSVKHLFEEGMVEVIARFMSGQRIHTREYPNHLRYTIKELDHEIITKLGELDHASANTKFKYTRDDDAVVLTKQSLVWRPLSLPQAVALADVDAPPIADGPSLSSNNGKSDVPLRDQSMMVAKAKVAPKAKVKRAAKGILAKAKAQPKAKHAVLKRPARKS
jgi:hypothetical protein